MLCHKIKKLIFYYQNSLMIKELLFDYTYVGKNKLRFLGFFFFFVFLKTFSGFSVSKSSSLALNQHQKKNDVWFGESVEYIICVTKSKIYRFLIEII
jgi:hypothetical protein